MPGCDFFLGSKQCISTSLNGAPTSGERQRDSFFSFSF